MNPLNAVDKLINKIKKDYANDVSLVVIMGSTIYNDTHKRSDIDMYFVPKTKKGENLQFTFIIDGIGYDFWGISWERLIGLSSYNESKTSILTEGKVLYYSSQEDINRFNQLKNNALQLDKEKFISLSIENFSNVYKYYLDMQIANSISKVRSVAIGIIYELAFSIALLNCTTIKRGRSKLKKEIMAMEFVPCDFEKLYDTAFYSNDIELIKQSYCTLIENTKNLIEDKRKEIILTENFFDRFNSLYEELINSYNKIEHACDINDAVTALFASVELTYAIEQTIENTGVSMTVFPNLVDAYDPNNLEKIAKKAKEHQAAFEKLLEAQKVPVRRFNDMDELEKYLNTL